MAELHSSAETRDLILELQEQRPDTLRVRWLVADAGANVAEALKQVGLTQEEIVKRNPSLGASLGLQR